MYVSHYKSSFSRFLFSIVQMFLTLWFKYLSWPLPQNNLDSQYKGIWDDACRHIATSTFTTSAYANVPHDPDARAAHLSPFGIKVISCPDEPIANLVKLNPNWSKHTDPSGTILQTVGNQYSTCVAFTLCGKHARVYAAASAIGTVLQYEFENIILQRLGYDVSYR